MKKNAKNRWLTLCILTMLSFSSFTAKPVVGQAVSFWLLGHATNSIDKHLGQWFTDEVVGAKDLRRKVIALDVKFFFNAVLKHFYNELLKITQDDPRFRLDEKTAIASAFGAGTKYLSLQELYVILKRAWIQWEKLHPSPDDTKLPTISSVLESIPSNITLLNDPELYQAKEVQDPHTLATACQEIITYIKRAYMQDQLDWIRNAPEQSLVIAQSLANDIPGVGVEALYFFTSYALTIFTRLLSECFLEPLVLATGFNPLSKDPISTIIKASIGIVLSEYLMMDYTMPYLEKFLTNAGLYDERHEELHKTMYKAGIKTPFARDCVTKLYETISNPEFYTAVVPVFVVIGNFLLGRAHLKQH